MPDWTTSTWIAALTLAVLVEGFLAFAYFGVRRTLPGHWTRLGYAISARNIALAAVAFDTYLHIFDWHPIGPPGSEILLAITAITSLVTLAFLHRHAERPGFWRDRDFLAGAAGAILLPLALVLATIAIKRNEADIADAWDRLGAWLA